MEDVQPITGAEQNVLSAASPFFFKLFQSDMKENREGVVQFGEISGAVYVMRDVLEFIYTGSVEVTQENSEDLMYQSIRSFNIPPGQPPGHLNFWKIFVQIPPSPGRKAVQMPPPLGKFPDYCFNFSVASVMFPKLRMLTWFIRQHIFIYYRYKSFLNTFKYGTKLV